MKKFTRALSLVLIIFLFFGIIILSPDKASEVNAYSGVSWKVKSGSSIAVNKIWELKTPEDVSEIEIVISNMEFVLSEEHVYDSSSDIERVYTVGDITYTLTPNKSYGYVQSYSVTMSTFTLTSQDGWTRTLNLPDPTAEIGDGYFLIYPDYCQEYIGGERQDDIYSGVPGSDYVVSFDSPSVDEEDYDTIYDDITLNVVNAPYYEGGYHFVMAKQWPSGLEKEDVTIEVYQDGVLFGELNLSSSSESVSGIDFKTQFYYADRDTLGISDDSEIWYISDLYLPKDDGQGHEYEYTFSESGDAYRYEVKVQKVSEFADYLVAVVTNQERLIDITVTKKWEGTEGDGAVVHLYAGNQEIDSVELTSGSWTHVFTGLPETDENGDIIEYSVTEDAVSGYTTEITGSAQDGFVITNTEESQPDLIDITVTKKWEGTEGTKAVVHLFAGDQEIDSVELTSGSWTHVFTDLPKTDENGNAIEYSVTEDAVNGYTAEITGSAQEGFLITNTEETTPVPEDDTDESDETSEETPRTGDCSYTGVYALIMIGSMAAAAVMIRKHKAEHKTSK